MIRDWWQHPFSADMDTTHWVAFVGLLLIIMVLWKFVLAHVLGGIE